MTEKGEELVWRDDWENAPRDGRFVRLKGDHVMSLRWSTSYSVFGLGGCWTDGLCTMGDKIDFTHWAEDTATEKGAEALCRIFNGDDWTELTGSERLTLRGAANHLVELGRREAATALSERDARIAELERERDEAFAGGQHAMARQVFALHEDTVERYHGIAERDAEKKEGAFARGRIVEAKSIAKAISAILPHRNRTTEKKDG